LDKKLTRHWGVTQTLDRWGGGTLAGVLLLVLLLQKLILERWPQAENPYQEFRMSPLSLFKREEGEA